MRKPPTFVPRARSSRWSRLLLLGALCALLALTASLVPPAAAAQSVCPPHMVCCTSDRQCPSGELCCFACGVCGWKTCQHPFNGMCPPLV